METVLLISTNSKLLSFFVEALKCSNILKDVEIEYQQNQIVLSSHDFKNIFIQEPIEDNSEFDEGELEIIAMKLGSKIVYSYPIHYRSGQFLYQVLKIVLSGNTESLLLDNNKGLMIERTEFFQLSPEELQL